jgi:hypothetical protein
MDLPPMPLDITDGESWQSAFVGEQELDYGAKALETGIPIRITIRPLLQLKLTPN